MFSNIDFNGGIVVVNDLDFDPTRSYEEQIWSFKQDILQVRYPNGYILDVGWYPEFCLDEGSFKIIIVQEYEWLNPIYEKQTKNLHSLYNCILEGINIIAGLK
ncbi:hypothetical protein N0M98_30330 [Paenibacillus doosanensis]|uniref:hypothetical protein n=1 Tax=Paenibacillus doosanensis TaxID=1229154 RepID=UPI00218039B1|nr:hypothetical protein [Paenibacillus doosanensis]MCS7464401.1 hypothetical protein [Paenibacillus doosanensis]